MADFNTFVQTELPKRPFVNVDGAAGQMLVRSSNPLAPRELVWADVGGTVTTGSIVPVQQVFSITEADQTTLVLGSTPINGIVMIDLNGLLLHQYTVVGSSVVLPDPLFVGDEVMVTWFAVLVG